MTDEQIERGEPSLWEGSPEYEMVIADRLDAMRYALLALQQATADIHQNPMASRGLPLTPTA
jgi:hypothetical protein